MSTKLKYDTPQALIDAGWQFNRECKCKSKKKYWYRHPAKPGLEVVWHPLGYQFKITNLGLTMRGLTTLGHLEAVLKTL